MAFFSFVPFPRFLSLYVLSFSTKERVLGTPSHYLRLRGRRDLDFLGGGIPDGSLNDLADDADVAGIYRRRRVSMPVLVWKRIRKKEHTAWCVDHDKGARDGGIDPAAPGHGMALAPALLQDLADVVWV